VGNPIFSLIIGLDFFSYRLLGVLPWSHTTPRLTARSRNEEATLKSREQWYPQKTWLNPTQNIFPKQAKLLPWKNMWNGFAVSFSKPGFNNRYLRPNFKFVFDFNRIDLANRFGLYFTHPGK